MVWGETGLKIPSWNLGRVGGGAASQGEGVAKDSKGLGVTGTRHLLEAEEQEAREEA